MKPLELAALEAHIAAVIKEHGLEEDETLRSDMLEGCTDVFEILAGITSEMMETRMLRVAATGRKSELDDRIGRFEKREWALKALAFRIMQAADIKKAPLAEATLSIRATPPVVIITDESELPDSVFKTTRTVSKTLVREKLEAGEFVPGASMSNGGSTLSVRTA